MDLQLNIHRFKVIARFGLMHVVATNLCVWIRTLVLEYIKEITIYHKNILNATQIVPVTEIAPFAGTFVFYFCCCVAIICFHG